MTVLERPPEAERTMEAPTQTERTGPVRVPEAIIPEARRRGRRRRAGSVLAAIVASGALVGTTGVILRVARATSHGSDAPLTPGPRTGAARAPAPLVAWGDYAGVLHLGDVTTKRQLKIDSFSGNQSGGPEAFARGRLLWVDAKGKVVSLEVATGRVRVLTRGTAVMASSDGSRLYVDQGTADFLEIDARTLRVTRRLPLPAGWTQDPWIARPVAGGLILTHTGPRAVRGIWHPGHGVQPIATATDLIDVYTPPGGRHSLVAWLPRCTGRASGSASGSGCQLAITNTATGSTVQVASPNHYGFTGGEFSPHGTELATFVNTDEPSDPYSTPRSELAIIDTRTGAMRLDPRVSLVSTEDAAWARWLPSGRQLLAGAIEATYLVNARSLSTRPFYFDGDATRVFSIMNSADLNFSTIVVPQSALSAKQRRALEGIPSPKRTG